MNSTANNIKSGRISARRARTLTLVEFAMLLAIEAIVCFTPLGSVPVGPFIVATLMMVPVIITAITLGTAAGTAMGFMSGLFSFIIWTFTPPNPATAFVFTPFYSLGTVHGNGWSLAICFIPRVLGGTVTGLCCGAFSRLLGRMRHKNGLIYALSGVLGSLTNTLLVLGGIYLFFGNAYAAAFKMAYTALLGALGFVVLTNGLAEAVLGGIAAYAIGYPLRRFRSRL